MTRPFEGIRIIDITHVLAGPFAAYQLAVLGADVIKVEHPDDPDQSRSGGTDRALNRAGLGTSFLVDPARVAIVGDAPAELEATLRDALSADAVLVSGGLGPTHDDRTVELVAKALGVGLRVDAELEREIEAVSRSAAERLKRDYADFEAGVTKQATVPEGAISLGLAGTAPGLVVPRGDGRVLVVLPGPPSELQRLWPRALETDAFQDLLARARPAGRRVYRLFGVSESAVARALAEAGGDGSGVEVTICAREFEIHVDVLVEPGVEERADALEQAFLVPLERWFYGRDERTMRSLNRLSAPQTSFISTARITSAWGMTAPRRKL